jgi:hypothetical protein
MAIRKANRSSWKIILVSWNSWFLKKNHPVTHETKKIIYCAKYYYFNNGFFNVKANYETRWASKGKIKYEINTGKATLLMYKTSISTAVLFALRTIKPSSLIKSGNQYRTIDFEEEKTELLHILEIRGIFSNLQM